MAHVISVGAGKNQLPLMKALNKRGYKVVGFDMDKNAPGKLFCDKFCDISTWDHRKAINWLDKLGIDYEGVGCFSYGKALATRLRIAQYFDLPAKVPENIININENKTELRKRLFERDMSSFEEFFLEESFDDLILNKEEYIIKPLTGGSSTGIKVILKSDLKKLFNKNMINEPIIIQEHLPGKEYRLLALVQESCVLFNELLYKENLKNTFFTGRLMPEEDFLWQENFLHKFLSEFNLNNVPIKMDIIKASKQAEILEVDFGVAGDYFGTNISKKYYNFDFINNYINLILNIPIRDISLIKKDWCFDYIYNLNNKPYIIDHDFLYKQLDELLGSVELIKTKEDGQSIGPPNSNLDNIAGVIHNRSDISNYDINFLINKKLEY